MLLAGIGANTIASLPLFFGLILYGEHIMSLYGREFINHRAVMILTAFTGIVLAVQLPIGNVIAGVGKMWVGALMNFGWGTVLIVATWVLVHHYGWGAEGVAAAYLIAYCALACWTVGFAITIMKSDGTSFSSLGGSKSVIALEM